MLMCDFGRLADEVAKLEAAGAQALHLDVMDGQFVQNITYGMPIIAAVRKATRLPVDVHLMISNPQNYLRQFRDAGADGCTIHIEAVPDALPVLDEIRSLGMSAGLALNPPTPLSAIQPHLSHCDLVLVMSVNPGFGSQVFDVRALDKLRQLRQLTAPETLLEVDGGVNPKTIAACAQAGAQLFVVGSAIFNQSDYSRQLQGLTALAHAGATSTGPME